MADVPVQSGTYSIGEVAKITGTTVKTVRYYDQIGLVKPVTHTEGGHRLYTTEEIWRLELILTLRYLSFGIEDIRKIISGEIPVSTALDWQIEALSTQQRMISNMISILKRAKEGDHGEESLRHIRELVESVHINTEERKKFILDKIQESMFIDQFPPDWHESLVQSVIGVLPKEGKLTSGQSAAWTELEELLNSAEFHQEFRESMGVFIQVVNQYLIDPEKWTNKMFESFERLSVAIQNRESPDSPAVQDVVNDYVAEFADMLQTPVTPELLRLFIGVARISGTNRVRRFWELRSIVNPDMRFLIHTKNLMYQGIQWKIAQLEAGETPYVDKKNE